AAASLLAVQTMRRIRGSGIALRRVRQPRPPGPDAPAEPMGAEGREQRAAALAAQGRWREAALALYQGRLHRLPAAGLVRLDPAETSGDYRRESRRDPASYRLLDTFLRRFEPLAFGGRPVDAAAFDSLRELPTAPRGNA